MENHKVLIFAGIGAALMALVCGLTSGYTAYAIESYFDNDPSNDNVNLGLAATIAVMTCAATAFANGVIKGELSRSNQGGGGWDQSEVSD